MSQQDELRRLIGIRKRRLQKLNERLAFEGSSTDPKIAMEIEDIEAEIEALQTQLAEGAFTAPLDEPNVPSAETLTGFKGVRIGEVQLMGCALRNFVIALSTMAVVFGFGAMLLTGQFGQSYPVATPPIIVAVTSAVTPTPNPTATKRVTAQAEEAAEGPRFEFGLVAFAAGVTEDFEPVEPLFEFTEGITQVHAIFEYQGLSPELTWSQTFYVGSEVITRPPQAWPGGEAGLYDFVIELEGAPLPVGEWVVEFYVEDELVMGEVFYIAPIPIPPE